MNKGNTVNSYRLAFCRENFFSIELVEATFCFLLQSCLAAYVTMEMASVFTGDRDKDEKEWDLENLPIALMTFFYSCFIAWSSGKSSWEAAGQVYFAEKKKITKQTLLFVMDVLVNTVLFALLLFAGFVVIMNQQSPIDAGKLRNPSLYPSSADAHRFDVADPSWQF